MSAGAAIPCGRPPGDLTFEVSVEPKIGAPVAPALGNVHTFLRLLVSTFSSLDRTD